MSFDWNLLKTFAAVTEHGSLAAAAHALASSQPTMSRHIAALEDDLGVPLFDRTGRRLELTPNGVELQEHARQMATAANRFSLAAVGRSETIAGTIRISASEIVASYILPDILTRLHRAEPAIEIELVATDRTENLLRREADIAIRMFRPDQYDVIARKIGEFQIAAFAANTYLEQRGEPETLADLLNHDIIGYDRSDQILMGFRDAGYEVDRQFFRFRCDNQVVAWKMVVAGFGVGFMQAGIGDAEPHVKRIPIADNDLPTLPIWLAAHTELKTSHRVRRVFDFLATELSRVARQQQA